MNDSETTIYQENFPVNQLFKYSVHRRNVDKDWQSPYFAYLKVVPKGEIKEKNSKGVIVAKQTYISDNHITFRVSLITLQAIGLAIRAYALGSGKGIADEYVIWADPSKAKHSGGESHGKKSFKIVMVPDRNKPEKRVVNIIASQQAVNGGQGRSITATFTPFDALVIADSIQFIIGHTREQRLSEANGFNNSGASRHLDNGRGAQQGQARVYSAHGRTGTGGLC